MIQQAMTAEEFSLKRSDLPDAGQWAELVRGVPVTLQPPDLEHGTIVLNLSKAFSAYVHTEMNGYPCFDLGLKLESSPDTILYPAISYFTEGERFSEMDNDYTDSTPTVVVDLATTGDRRAGISERISLYLKTGVQSVWIADPNARTIHILRKTNHSAIRLDENDILNGAPDLQGFRIKVAQIFADPDWA
ncbi:Uma2 family endonuclease [Thalassoglobus polymorphus]|uniref:Putative restriction endonuclease domain-containing protein n=1 Tax=Thalassoglobus polymorphus TaxID=2527994 RepID=A0A517QL07_9PLAN|nr:Uma2 family endonuclease [Thalassoglobus polymorphus]QDT32294.1 hypothetical protein Mal48_15370 [Thalassoglobus polymorphus]